MDSNKRDDETLEENQTFWNLEEAWKPLNLEEVKFGDTMWKLETIWPDLHLVEEELSDTLSSLWRKDFNEISWDDKKIDLPEELKWIGKIYKLPEEWKEIIKNKFEFWRIDWKAFCMIGWDREYFITIQNGEFHIVLWLNIHFTNVGSDQSLKKLYKESYSCSDESINKIILQRFSRHVAYVLNSVFNHLDDKWIEIKQDYDSSLEELIRGSFEEKELIQKENMAFMAKKRGVSIDDIYALEIPYISVDWHEYITLRWQEGVVSPSIDKYGEAERMDNIWRFASNNSILAFVWPTGSLFIAKNTIENQNELEKIWYQKWYFWVPFSNGELNSYVDMFKQDAF